MASPNLGDEEKDIKYEAYSEETCKETNRTSVSALVREQLNHQELSNLPDRKQLKWDDIKQQSTNEYLDDLSLLIKTDFHDQNKNSDDSDKLTGTNVEKASNKHSSVDDCEFTTAVGKGGAKLNVENQGGAKLNPAKDKVISKDVVTTQQCSIDIDKQTGHQSNDPIALAQQEFTNYQRNIEETNKLGSFSGDRLILPGKDNRYVPLTDDNNSCSVGFDYCENSELDCVQTTNFSSISQIDSHKTFNTRTNTDTTSKGGITPDNEIKQSCSKSGPLSITISEEQRLCSTKDNNGQHDVNTDKSCDQTVQNVHSPNKRKSPSVQARRLKLDALVENIKSLKAAETKEPLIKKETDDSDVTLKVQTLDEKLGKELSISNSDVKSECELDSVKAIPVSDTTVKLEESISLKQKNDSVQSSVLEKQEFEFNSENRLSNDSKASVKVEQTSGCAGNNLDAHSGVKKEKSSNSSSVKVCNESNTCLTENENESFESRSKTLHTDSNKCPKVEKITESISETSQRNSCSKVEEITESNSVRTDLSSSIKVEENVYNVKSCTKNACTSSIKDEVEDLNTNSSVNKKDHLKNENTLQCSKNFEGNEQTTPVVSFIVEDNQSVENIEDKDSSSYNSKNRNGKNDTEVKSEIEKETSEQSKSQFLKPPIFHFDSQSKKKIYEFSDVFGNKQPVVYLGERVSKEKTLTTDQSETSRLTKLANVKTKKPVKKIEMIRHPPRRIKRVASLNALAMVNILFGKDDSPPKIHKSEKVINKKVVSSKSLSKAKLILEEKVKCLLKKAKAMKELNQSEDTGQTKVKKEKTTPKKISQIEKSLAKLTLDSSPMKTQTVTESQNSASPEKSPKKVSSPSKSPTKASPSTKSGTKTSESKKVPTKSKKEKKTSTGDTTKINEKKTENSEIKKKKGNVEKNTKGEKNKKGSDKVKKEEKISKKKNTESDVNKTNPPKQRKKKGELLRSARTHSFHEVKIKKSDNTEISKEQSTQPCVNCQNKTWKNDGDKSNFVDGSVQYNVGHVESGTYSTHSYGVVPSTPGPCVHCSQNGGIYTSQGHMGQGSSFIGGIMGQPGSIVSPCQTFTIGSVPMVQYHHPFGTGYPIQYQSHSALPHCGYPSCYYYTPTASPLPHHDACHHSVPPTYAPVRDDTSGIYPSYGTSHSEGDIEIDIIGGVSPLHISDHHLPSSAGKSVEDVEIDVVGGVPPLTFSNDKDLLPSPKKKKKKTDSESETKKKLDKNTKNKENTKVLKSDKENKEKQVKKKKDIVDKQKEKEVRKKVEKKKETKDKSKESTETLKVTKKKSAEDIKVKKAQTLSELAEELKAMKNKKLSKSTEELKVVKKKDSKSSGGSKVTKNISNKASENVKPDTTRKRSMSKSPDDQDKTAKKRKVSKSIDERVLDRKKLTATKRKSSDSVFSGEVKPTTGKQNKTSKTKTTKTLINRSKSVDAKVLKEIEVSKTYPKRKRVVSLTRQLSTESEIAPRRKSSSSKSTSSDKTVKKKVETKKPKKKNHDWEFISPPEKKKIMVSGSQVERECYPAIKHTDGDMIYVRDVVILRSGPRKTDIPYLGKVTAFWEENDEMMMGLLWYYHPEHTDTGRQPHHLPVEIFASKHRDENSIACIDDKGYVLTYNEYCRYRAEKCRTESTLPPRSMVVPVLEDSPRAQRIPPPDVDANTVYMCRQVYDFKSKRILKNPS